MASKQLGKFRQWAGEVISSKDKSAPTEEFKKLERDIELRKEGLNKIQAASEIYHKALSKKKISDAAGDPDKLLPIDSLGVVMIGHGEEFGLDSAFGNALVALGNAHCKIATLQEAYALNLQDTYLASLLRFNEEIKEYEVQRKKLESRRLSYDAAITKHEKMKNSKKEKDRKEAEEEMYKAQDRYEEISEEVVARMHTIQENEIEQLRELTRFLDTEIGFVEQYMSVLLDVKENWKDESLINKNDKSWKKEGPTHVFSRAEDKNGSVRSRRSATTTTKYSEKGSDDEGKKSRSSSKARRRESLAKPPSRPSSRTSRHRADSVGAPAESKKTGVTGWASGAVGAVTGRKRGKDKFASLKDGEDEERDEETQARGATNSPGSIFKKSPKAKPASITSSPRMQTKIGLPPSLQARKLVRASHDFTGSSDELSFRAGDEIVVVNEVLDDWWMGELDGKKGLFPTSYVDVIDGKGSLRRNGTKTTSRRGRRSPHDSESDSDSDPLGERIEVDASPFDNVSDTASVGNSILNHEEEEQAGLVSATKKAPQAYDQSLVAQARRSVLGKRSVPDINLGASFSSTVKKGPPPPPPRRTNTTVGVAPAVPERRPAVGRSQSFGATGGRPKSITDSLTSTSAHGHDASPFDSAVEIASASSGGGNGVPGRVGKFPGGCGDFKQNPFKPAGMCSNCFQFHV